MNDISVKTERRTLNDCILISGECEAVHSHISVRSSQVIDYWIKIWSSAVAKAEKNIQSARQSVEKPHLSL